MSNEVNLSKDKDVVVFKRVYPFASGRDDVVAVTSLPNGTKICQRPHAKVSPDEPGMTYPDYSDQVDVQSIIDKNIDNCGLSYALRQINEGRLLPSQLFDDANRRYDVSELPDNVNEAYELAKSSEVGAKQVSEELNITKLDANHLEAMIAKAVEDRFNATQQKNSEVSKNE